MVAVNGCKHERMHRTTPLPFVVPPGFPQPAHNFQANPVSEEGFALGRKLFYDGRLSKDGHYSCESCHQKVAVFTTFEHDRSHGYANSHTLRNAPGLFNLAWLNEYNQDGSGASLQAISEAHITHPFEMGETMGGVVDKLKGDAEYKRLFQAAFGDEQVSSGRILNALSQFLVSMVSANSKYDKVKRGEASFTSFEQRGYDVFKAKCASCHTEPLFTDFSYRNIGLPVDAGLNDYGRMRVTGNRADSLKFRVPSLRNVALTSHYGHDGRFSMFATVLEHYRSGVVQGPTLDPALANGIALSSSEMNELVQFLHTLTDSSFLNNPRYGM